MRDVAEWLNSLDLGEYAEAFAQNKIDAGVLPSLTGDDLKEMGVVAVGDRRRLLRAIAQLKAVHRDHDRPDADVHGNAVEEASAERRQLTVMFCDLVGSTTLSVEFDPEDVAAVIRAYHECCAKVAERWEGHIAKFMGDGILIYFGWPRAHEDDAERAVRAGIEITRAVAQLDTPISRPMMARVGIATGPVMVGALSGQGAAREHTVVGETPNLAARLQSMAEPGSVVVAPSTRQLLGRLFTLNDLGPKLLKGFAEPLRAWCVAGEAPRETRFEALHGRRLLAPLVGRDEEIALLTKRFRQAETGEGQVVLISGEAGIGKSRLCESFRATLAERPHKRLTYQCSPYHTDRAFHPVIAQIEQAADIRSNLSSADKLHRLRAMLGLPDAAAGERLSVLATLLSISGEERSASPSLDAQQAEPTYAALTALLESACTDSPLVVVFEDLHWCDPSTLELLNRFVERVESLPILLLVTCRPELHLAWSDQPHVTTLMLNRINKRECMELLDSLTASNPLPESVADEIVRRSDGVPLFAEEIARTVIDARLDASGRRSSDLPLEVPASLQDSLMSRLDRLHTGKRVVQAAAAIGREFTLELIGCVCDLKGNALRLALEELVEAGLLVSRPSASGPTYLFKHALVRDAAYNTLLRENRRRLHSRIAVELGAHLADQPALLAHHYESAGAWEEALECRRRAAAQAASRFAVWEAAEQYRRVIYALEHLPDTPEHRQCFTETVLAQVAQGGNYKTEQERAEALRHIDKAIELAAGDLASLARLEARKGFDRLDESMLASAERHAKRVGDDRLRAEVAEQYASFLGLIGRFEESLAKMDQALELFEKIGAHAELGMTAAGSGRCYFARAGRLERSLGLADLARRIAEATGDPQVRSWLAMETEPLMYKGHWKRTVKVARRHLPAAWEYGQWPVVLWSSAWATIACLKLGDLQEARALMDPAMTLAARRLDDDYCKIYPHVALSQLHLAHGEAEAALQAAQRALELAKRVMAKLEIGAACRALAEACSAKMDHASAETQFCQSLAILGDIQSRPELAQSLLAYGRFKRVSNPGEGEALLRRALEHFTEMDATGWVEETQTALRIERQC